MTFIVIQARTQSIDWNCLFPLLFLISFSQNLLALKLENLWFYDFLVKNYSLKSEKSKFSKKPCNFVWNYVRSVWSKFQPIWAKTATSDTVWVKFEKITFSVFAIFWAKLVKLLKNVFITWSKLDIVNLVSIKTTFCEFLGLKCKYFSFNSLKKLILGAIFIKFYYRKV